MRGCAPGFTVDVGQPLADLRRWCVTSGLSAPAFLAQGMLVVDRNPDTDLERALILALYPIIVASHRSPAGGAPTPASPQYVLTGDVQDFTPEDNADFYANPADVDDRGIVANLLGPDGLPGKYRGWQDCRFYLGSGRVEGAVASGGGLSLW